MATLMGKMHFMNEQQQTTSPTSPITHERTDPRPILDRAVATGGSVIAGIRPDRLSAIITEPFEATCRAMAALHGFDDYPFIIVPHPVASLTIDEVHQLADSVTASVVALLTTDAARGSGRAEETLADVVEGLAQGLRSDGADLTAHQPDDRTVVFELHIPDQACAECVMPAPTLLSVFTARVHASLGSHLGVRLDDPRDAAGTLRS